VTVDNQQRFDLAARMLGPIADRDVPLGAMTTYRVGGAAALFARPHSVADLADIATAAAASELDVLVIGRGSNMLVADHGFAGIAVSLADMSEDIDIDIDDAVVRAGAAVALPVLARRTVGSGLTGFEWAVGVPGSVGGGVRMNAGGHGSDMAAVLVDVGLFDIDRNEAATIPASRLGLRFRGSDLADHQVVLWARLQLHPGDRASSQAELDEIVRWRRDNQPGGQNAGSVFVNPVPGEVTAGALIDDAGLRGVRIGTACVSDKHANFIQADEGGSAADVRSLIQHVREVVAARSGYVMRSEVRLVGFADLEPGGAVADRAPGVQW
jgi:UDP-N-acetylmuramate dehydrogenase